MPKRPSRDRCWRTDNLIIGLDRQDSARKLYRGTGMPRRSSMRSIDGRSLDLDDVIAVARKGEPVRLAPAAAKCVDASRRALEMGVAKGSLAYGIQMCCCGLVNVDYS